MPMIPDARKSVPFLVLSLYLVLVAVFSVLQIGFTYESPVLLATLNTFFCAAVGLIVVYLAAGSFRATGSGPVLLMGCGALAFAITYVLAGLLLWDLNAAVTVHNTGVFLAASFFMVSAIRALAEKPRRTPALPLHYPGGAYLAVSAAMALLTVAALAGVTPVFFSAATGMTLLRQAVLVATVAEFAVAAACLGVLYRRSKTPFLRWYCFSLALIGIGMGTLIFEGNPATPLSWVGRLGQYLGGLYLLAAVFTLGRDGGDWRIPLDKALEHEREFIARLLSTAGGPVIVLDPEGRIVRFNRACERITGFSFSEVRGRMVWDLIILPEEVAAVKEIFANLMAGHSPEEFEHSWVAKDGTRRFIRWSGSVVTGPDGSVEYVIGTGLDITERRRAEEELQQKNTDLNALNEALTSAQEDLRAANDAIGRNERELALRNAQLQALFDYSVASLVLFDAKKPYTVLAHNTYYQQLWREPFRSDGMVGKNLYDYVPDVEVSGVMAVYDEVVATRQAKVLLHFPYDGMDRGRTYWDWHLSPVMQGGEVIALAHMAIDVTNEVAARREIEKTAAALRESEERMRIAMEAADLGTWEYDLATGSAMHSPRHDRIFGYLKPVPSWSYEISVKHMLPEFHAAVRRAYEEAMRKTGRVSFEAQVRWPDGSIHWIHVFGQVQCDSEGRAVRMAGVVADITDRRRADDEAIRKHEALNALNKELTATEEKLHRTIGELSRREQALNTALAEKEVLLSEIHHRVKNNLTAFISLLSLEGSTEDSPAGRMLKNDLQNRARSMALVHETLYRTRRYHEVDMGVYLENLVDQVARSFRTMKGVKTVVDASGVMLDIARATPAGLIVNELVTNSFKYAFPASFDAEAARHAPPTITVSLTKNDGAFSMVVRDNGIGLPAGLDLAKISTLGLKLVTFLAKHQFGAEIEVHAEDGTEFVFRSRE